MHGWPVDLEDALRGIVPAMETSSVGLVRQGCTSCGFVFEQVAVSPTSAWTEGRVFDRIDRCPRCQSDALRLVGGPGFPEPRRPDRDGLARVEFVWVGDR